MGSRRGGELGVWGLLGDTPKGGIWTRIDRVHAVDVVKWLTTRYTILFEGIQKTSDSNKFYLYQTNLWQ